MMAVLAVVALSPVLRADSIDDQYALAAGYYERQQWQPAAEEFQKFAAANPNDPRAIVAVFFRAESLLQLGKLDEALPLFRHYLTGEPEGQNARAALFRAGETAYLLGNHAEAKPDLERFLAKYPDDRLGAFALPYLGNIALAAEDLPAAEGYFRDGLKKFPEGALQDDCRFGLARSLESQHQLGEAVQLYKEVAAQTDGAQADAAEYRLGAMAFSEGQYERALEYFATLERQWPSSSWLPNARLGRGLSLVRLHRPGDAIADLEAFLQTKPEGDSAVEAAGELAICYTQSGQIEKAKKLFDELVAKDPNHRWIAPMTERLAEAAYDANDTAWSSQLSARLAASSDSAEYGIKGTLGLAWSLFKSGKLDESAATFDEVLAKNPPEAVAVEAALARGRILEQLGQPRPALAMYEMVIEKHSADRRKADALLSAGRLYDALKEPQKAAEAYRKIVDECPEFADRDAALYRWAWTTREMGRPEESDRLFERLRKEYPTSRFATDAGCRLTERALDAGDHAKASAMIDEVLGDEPSAGANDPDVVQARQYAMFLRGRVAESRSDWPKVREAYEAFVKESPNSPRRPLADFWIAESYYRQGDHAAASERFDRLAEQIGTDRKPWMAMIPLRRAQILAQQDQWNDAYRIATTIAEDFPGFPQQYEVDYLLGRCLANRAEFDEARRAYQRVIESNAGAKTETAAMAQWMIGETFFHQKNFEAAYREYLKVEILYQYPVCQAGGLLQAGKCCERLGKAKDAAELYRRIVKTYPETPYMAEASERLAKLAPPKAKE